LFISIVFNWTLAVHAPLACSIVTLSLIWVLAMITPLTEGTITETVQVPSWSPCLQQIGKEDSKVMLPAESTVFGFISDIPRDELCKILDFAVDNDGVLLTALLIQFLHCVCLPMDHFILPFTFHFLPDNLLGVAFKKKFVTNEKKWGFISFFYLDGVNAFSINMLQASSIPFAFLCLLMTDLLTMCL
jgi:hypothetical protein